MGRTLDTLCSQLNLSDINLLTSTGVKKNLKYCEIPADQQWRSSMVTELIKLMNQSLSPWLHSRRNQCNVGLHMHHLGLLFSSCWQVFSPGISSFSPAPPRTKFSHQHKLYQSYCVRIKVIIIIFVCQSSDNKPSDLFWTMWDIFELDV